jgi:hypothetical protein
LKQGCGSGSAWIRINLSCPDPSVKTYFIICQNGFLTFFSLKEK